MTEKEEKSGRKLEHVQRIEEQGGSRVEDAVGVHAGRLVTNKLDPIGHTIHAATEPGKASHF